MSDAFWVALFGLVGTCLTAWLSWLNRQELKSASGKADAVITGNDKIHELVNSKMSAALAEIERLKGIVETLQAGGTHP